MEFFEIETVKLEKKPELNLSEEKPIHLESLLIIKDIIIKIPDFINQNIGIDKYIYR